jgi:hypothetical protein
VDLPLNGVEIKTGKAGCLPCGPILGIDHFSPEMGVAIQGLIHSDDNNS